MSFSRFKNGKLVRHQEELDHILAAVLEECDTRIEELRESGVVPADAPRLGEVLAIDATDIPAYARARGEHCDPPGKENCKKGHKRHCNAPTPAGCTRCSHELCPDPDAEWGYRTRKSKSPRAETGRKAGEDRGELFFGFAADVIADAHFGLPLYVSVRAANTNEGPALRSDLDAALRLHPWLRSRSR